MIRRPLAAAARAVSIAAVLLLLLLLGGACARQRSAPPVVLITLDTTRRDHLPIYGYGRDTAPRISALARRSVVFDDAVAVHTNTAPSHASILTGLYPMQHGIERNGYRLRPDVPSLAEILARHGYTTAAFVSGWTLTGHTGLERGFDRYDQQMHEEHRRKGELTLAAALPWLREQMAAQRPFFLLFHLFDPHYAYDPPAQDARRFLPPGGFTTVPNARPPGLRTEWGWSEAQYDEYVRRYDGEIAYADRQVGHLLDALEEGGAAERALVVVVADHGETLAERAWVFDHGGRVYDEQIRIPLVIRLPGGRHAGARVRSPVSQVDLLPTILDALGIALPGPVAGRSLLPLVDGETGADRQRPTFGHARPQPERVPEIRTALVQEGLISAIRLPGFKLVEYPAPGGGWVPQLFDLAADPGERRDLAGERLDLVAALHAQLEAFRRATGRDRVAPPTQLDPEVEEALRALGYLR